MTNGEINVAYEGTAGDLSVTGAESMFDQLAKHEFDFDHFGDGFTAINDGVVPGVTVSPKDVFNTDSIPPSTSFTNLTTPGSTFLDTPDEDYQTSPLFSDSLGMEQHASDNWFSLFPEEPTQTVPQVPAPLMTRTTSASSASQIMVHPGGESISRKRSSANTSPSAFSPAMKHSNVAGVNARKRDKPLPPIVVAEDDPVALKRARNTAAARKSRAKKVEERDGLENQIADLKKQVDHWKTLAVGLGASPDL